MSGRAAFIFAIFCCLSAIAWFGGDVRGAQIHLAAAGIILALGRPK